ncbi:MAG: Na(+)/H(+) antiporter subunit D [Acidobacteria bacterium]|nr:Na(+)/H(+) antiporter subunit D [Acidobacteriota bacterium]
MMSNLHPAFILFVGAFLPLVFKGKARNWVMLAVALVTFGVTVSLPFGDSLSASWMGFELDLLRVDALSRTFAIIFTLSLVAAYIYAMYLDEAVPYIASSIYVGSALGAVFAGDLISLYMFWEIMAVSSTFLILIRRRKGSARSASRYVLIHLMGGLILLAGVLMTCVTTGTTAFDAAIMDPRTPASWLILVGILINAAAPPLSAWLSDSYPEATVFGGIILSAYTTKTAVYTLLRGFPGWEILIVVGCVMAIYGIIYALLENDMRRILAYSIINQVGFMVCAAGIGTEMAINGAVAHAFCHIIYKALLWMSAGAVLYRTGTEKCTELGGLYKSMPTTMVLGTIGALAISSVPGTSGFTSKTMILVAAADQHLFWPWMILEIASAGVFLHAGIKFPYFVFFDKDRGLRPKRALPSMTLGMGLLAFLCLFLGVYPKPLYDLLPYQQMFLDGFSVFHAEKLVTQFQMLLFSGLVFFMFLPLLKRTATISLDTDWIYRKVVYRSMVSLARVLNGTNARAYALFAQKLPHVLFHFFNHGPSRLVVFVLTPFWQIQGLDWQEIAYRQRLMYRRASLGIYPVGLAAIFVAIFFGLLYLT